MAHIRKRTLSDGSVAYRVVWDDPTGRRYTKQFSRANGPRPAQAAKDFMIRLEDELRRGTYVDPRAGQVTFAEFAAQWSEQSLHRPTTETRVEQALRLHLNPLIGTTRLGALRRRDIQQLINTLRVKPLTAPGRTGTLSAKSVHTIFEVLRSVCHAAVRERLIPESPCHDIRLPELPAEPVVIPTEEQVHSIAAAVPAHLRAVVLLAAGSGLRSGELRGLDVARVRTLERLVVVDRQLARETASSGGVPLYGPPKSRPSYRKVPLADSYVAVVAEHLARFGTGPDDLIFTNAVGAPLTSQAVQHALEPILREHGFPKQTGLHLFRHYYASGLIAAGVDLLTVARYLGHSTVKQIEKTYGHLWHDHMDRTRAAIETAFPAPSGGFAEAPTGRRRPSQGAAAESARWSNTSGHVVELRPASSGDR